MREIWKDINNYEGLYQISDLGNIRRLRFINNTTNKEKISYLKPWSNGHKYLVVSLMKNGVRKNHYIHRLVAQAFLLNPNNYKEINHKDNNPQNNHKDNLEWCNRSYNVKYSFTHGYHIAPKSMLGKFGYNNHLSKPIEQIDVNTGLVIREWANAHEVQRQLKLCRSSISKCCQKKQYTCGGYGWRYKNGNLDIKKQTRDITP